LHDSLQYLHSNDLHNLARKYPLLMASSKTAIVLGITADIGRGIAERLVGDGWNVVGIGRALERVQDLLNKRGFDLYQCPITDKQRLQSLIGDLQDKAVQWDLLISSVGTT
jgi:NADP-dependent 3-hydroxy acid dehydrogenase YdfG